MFAMVVVNTKVVDNFIILLLFKFHDHRPDSLGVMKLTNALSCSASSLNRSQWMVCLTFVHRESCLGDNKISVVLLLRFPKCLR